MRNWIARIVCLSAVLALLSPSANAQRRPSKTPPGTIQKPSSSDHARKARGRIDIDIEDSDMTAVAGMMSEEAAAATRLFESERWSEAVLAFYPVYVGETGDDAGNRQLAQYNLAVALYRLKFYQLSFGLFSEIVDKPYHLRFQEAERWLSSF